MTVYTIGYGGRSIEEFIALLQQYGVLTLVDARSLPTSRFQPAFRKKALEEHLTGAGIRYVYKGDVLGGKRVDPHALVAGEIDLKRLAELPDFREGIEQSAALAVEAEQQGGAIAFMCAERKPESCHRAYMLAPQMLERGFEVRHIDERGDLKTHDQVIPEPDDA